MTGTVFGGPSDVTVMGDYGCHCFERPLTGIVFKGCPTVTYRCSLVAIVMGVLWFHHNRNSVACTAFRSLLTVTVMGGSLDGTVFGDPITVTIMGALWLALLWLSHGGHCIWESSCCHLWVSRGFTVMEVLWLAMYMGIL